jgi:hypothetical protein
MFTIDGQREARTMIRTNAFNCKATLRAAAAVSALFLFAAVAAFGQQQINLTAAPTTTTLPDGTTVPMWSYFCGSAVTGSTATCAALNSTILPVGSSWSPVVITVPTGTPTAPASLTINLTNKLSFTPATGSTTANTVPTSIVIVGQVGGGLGGAPTTTQSPSHALVQGCPTWFIASGATPPGVPCPAAQAGASGTPPVQGPRVRSMGAEVAAGATTSLTWAGLKPGTYLLESGTHPSIQVPMGLIGVLVVTTAPSGAVAGTAYPSTSTSVAVPYNAEVPLEFSEIDPVQNNEVDQAVRTAGFSETAVWTRMNAFGPITALTLSNVGSGYTAAPTVTIGAPTNGVPATATATVGALVSSIAVTAGGTGYSATPTVTITDTAGTGTGATATATVVSGVITAITVTNPGSLYTTPTVAITDTTGTGATATAAITGTPGAIYALNLTNGGEGYTAAAPVTIAAPTTGTAATATAAVTLGGCGGSGAHTCYPPAVNYTPFYYLINGVAFSKTMPTNSVFQATAGTGTTISTITGLPLPVTTGITGTVLMRLVNAGLRMHVPSIVNSLTQGFNGAGATATVSGFTLIAEDGNVIPGVAPLGAATVPAAPRVQTDVLMVPSKVYDVLVNVPAVPSGATATPAIPVYARDLALSGNSSVRDAGMLAYISVNNAAGAGLPVTTGTGVFVTAKANADTYNALVAGQPFTVSDPSKGVIANDINVYGVKLLTQPTSGTITCGALAQSTPTAGLCANGTFTYTPSGTATSDFFTYCANNGFVPAAGTTPASCSSASLTATVTLGPSGLSAGTVTVNNLTYTSKLATFLKIPSPGVLSVDSDSNNLPLQVVLSSVAPASGVTINMDPNGGFTASATGAGTYTFTYVAQNSHGTQSAAATVTLIFPTPSALQVNVVDALQYSNCNRNSTCITGLTPLTDYRWIIEEDQTFYVDPNCTTNSSIKTPGCPTIVGGAGTSSTIPTFGVNFHTSAMNFVAQGCTGPLSCEYGQTMLDNRPMCTTPPSGTTPGVPAGCSTTAGQHIPAVCDLGNGACRPDPGDGTSSGGFTWVNPNQVALDPAKRYYISVLPGDAGNPFPAYVGQPICVSGSNTSTCGHTMGGAEIPAACNILGGPSACTVPSTFQPVTVLVPPTPLPTGRLSLIVFEDDWPLNGEQDGGGGTGSTVAPIEPGLGGFNIVLWDTYGGFGDVTGQDSNDMFNMPLSNGLAGTVDPNSGVDACPISATPLAGPAGAGPAPASGITGMIVTCPKYEADGQTLSPLAGQAVIYNLMPEKFDVQAYPGADRIARGEEWLQTNTLDGQHPHDAFIRIGEPSYFQEYGPAGYHVSIGFANPAIINARHNDVCNGNGTPGTVGPCTNTIIGQVDVQRLSRTPDQRLYPSGSRDALAWTQCWVSLGDPDGEDFMFAKCDANGNFKFSTVPGGNWRLTIGDQWNDQIVDGLSYPANVGCTSTAPNGVINATTCPGGQTIDLGKIGVPQWQVNLYTRTFIDDNKDGIWEPNEIGIPLIYTMVHYRDGHNANSLVTDFNGIANFNETFPTFNWYVVEADSTRYKTTGIHTVYDSGGPADGSTYCGPANGARPCGTTTAYNFLTNTFEGVPLPADLSVPGAVYCAKADCTTEATSFAAGTAIQSSPTASTGRIDPPWVTSEGWSGLMSQGNYIDFGKAPYAACPPACATVTSTPSGGTATTTQVGENGGIHGQVGYSSTRPFDDASQMIQQPWEPLVPRVTINLYQEGFAADGLTPTLTMVDTTQTSSWDDWAQGFYPGSTAGSGSSAGVKPYMSCPGQGTNVAGSPNQDVFFFTLFDQPEWLEYYNDVLHGTATSPTPLPYNSQYKCYDGMHIWNQLQPAPYDGKYQFPSSLGVNPTTGALLAASGATNGVASSMPGTNCTVCVANPDATDKHRFGTPMLPPGKYVVQVMMPPGYEVYKEEDKNLLIGDNYIAPVTQQFAGLGTDIFIIPDQASVASLYDESNAGYNPNNFQNQTTGLGLANELSGVPGFPGFQDPNWPCVGEMRTVPDYLTLFPQVKEAGPFAGAIRPLCDRKEVTLANQMSVSAKFYIFTSTHIAAKYSGVITDDFTSEFDPFAPMFGEKFSPPNLPVSTRDFLGNEISRVYSDHWGIFNGLTFSSWEVNPPNITGYSPSMMINCMNDPGPIVDNNPGSPTYGQLITDPLYNPAYSDFCYEDPYMPGLTSYLDTPVVPTQGFVGAGYNNPDCGYPDTTPAIKEVDGDGIGPWVSKPGVTLTITALGNQQVNNSAYSGPSANTAPFNLKTITHHYGFGGQCLAPTAGSATCNTLSSVTIGGMSATIDSWSDTQILVTVPSGVPNCALQQQSQYQGSSLLGSATAQCGQLVITAGNGKQSIDTVTVTIGGKTPTHVSAQSSIQSAIDGALPGDLIIVDPTCMTTGTSPASATCSAGALNAATPTQTASLAAHSEMLIMWKPVRLQGVGAVASVINANANPAGRLLDPWRRHINCLFGLTLAGVPVGTTTTTGGTPAVYDPSGTYSCPDTGWNPQTWIGAVNLPQVDRLPLEAVVGWDATVNGNLAEQLQEPSLMGAYEGAGITVLGKGVWLPPGVSPWNDGSEPGAFPAGTLLLQDVPAALPAVPAQSSYCTVNPNPYPSNFECNPSSIDGLSITDSSQGGGGIFVHGWAHNLQIANNRVYNNAGTLSGGITVGQGEFPPSITITSLSAGVGQQSVLNAPPSCQNSNVVGAHLPYCLDVNVNVHNNYIVSNSSLGDELFSGTLAGGGGASFCNGSDYYKFQYNWVCGNASTGEGGGLEHMGFMYNGDIEHNTVTLNQSVNPTIPTNGGGIVVLGTPDTDPVCGTQNDADCPAGLSDGTGPGLVINANLIQANSAESGSGGGIRLQQVNGTDVSTFPTQPTLWNNVSITNNMIVNNVAGWDGAGISLQDSLNVSIINNTIASNDSLATSGVLTQSIGTPLASAPAGYCVQAGPTGPTSASCPQPAGVASTTNSSVLTTTFTGLTITCPTGQPNCTGFSNPLLQNNVIWQNRSFYIGITGPGTGNQNQQNLVSLFTASGSVPPPQTASGQCSSAVNYWDIGVRNDTGPSNHGSGFTLNPTFSVLDDPADYPTGSNLGGNPSIVSQYCNGSRVPPTCTVADGCGGPSGYGVPPGIADATVPNPVFSLTSSATVDEGNNWINVSWGPLALSDDSLTGGAFGNYGGGPAFGNYALAAGSPAIDYVPITTTTLPVGTVPQLNTDFYGNPRPDPGNTTHFDIGAIEFQNNGAQGGLNSITPNTGVAGTAVNVTITGTGLTGASAVNVSGNNIAVSNFAAVSATTVTATFTISGGASLTARNVTVTIPTGTAGPVTFTVVAAPAPTLTSICVTGSTPCVNSELRGTSVNVTLTGTNFVAGAAVNIPGGTAAGFSIGGVTFVNATTITATFTANSSATLGARDIYVTNPGGVDSNTLPFTITGPVLTSIATCATTQVPPVFPCTGPASGNRGTTFGVTLTGSGLTGATSVNISGGGGITATGVTSVNDTTVNATFTISNGTSGGARNVTVVTLTAGTSNAVTFTVTVPPVGLTSIAPNTGAQGTVQAVTLTGMSFQSATNPATGIAVSAGGGGGGGGITVGAFTVVSDTTITANFTISPTAALTARNVTVTTAAGPTTPVTFTVVTPGTPTLTSLSPNSGVRGTPHTVTLTGTGFTATGTAVHVVAPANGLSFNGFTFLSATTITASFNTSGSATIGPRDIYVTTPGGTTGTVTYTVGGPVLTDISPNQAVRGTTQQVSLFGSGLTNVASIGGAGGGVTVSGLTRVNDSQVNATFTISPTATAGVRNITVTTTAGNGGTSNTIGFTIISLPAPTLASIAPNTGVRGTSASYMLTGTNFTGATAVAISGGGVTCSGIQVLDPETAMATCTISATASLTATRNTTISTGSGPSTQTVPFTVQGPTLSSIAGTPGVRGTTVPVVLTGSNLTGATAVTVGGGVTCAIVTADTTATNVTANCTTTPTASLTATRTITVTTPIGTTNAEPFTVANPPAATLTSIAPTSSTVAQRGTTVAVTLTGSNFTTGSTVAAGTGITVSGVTIVSSTQITANFAISASATTGIGAHNVTVTNASGTASNSMTFTKN